MHYEKFQDGTVKCIEDEIPFEVPKGWAWTRLYNIATVKGGKRIPKGMAFSSYRTNHAYIRVTDMKNSTVNMQNLKYIDENVFELIKNYVVSKDDLYITIAGTIGVVGEIPPELSGMNLTENAAKVSSIGIEKSYLCFMLQSSSCQKQFHHKTYQVAMPKLGLERIYSTLVPICGMKTQLQIIETTQVALKAIDEIDETKVNILGAVSSARTKILDLAIRGKLVPQDPSDESASVLLERIREEKEELIKKGKIKRDKNDSVIFKGDDNSYYDSLPKNWAVAALRDITNSDLLNDGDWILSENMDENGSVKLIQLGSVGFMKYVDKGFKHITDETCEKLSCTLIKPSYMLINRIISEKMCVCILPKLDGKLITTVDTCWVSPNSDNYNLKYLLYALSSPDFQSLVVLNAGGNTRKRISKTNLIALPIPFPPLAEQQRIVDAIEKSFAYLDQISTSLS